MQRDMFFNRKTGRVIEKRLGRSVIHPWIMSPSTFSDFVCNLCQIDNNFHHINMGQEGRPPEKTEVFCI